MSITLLNEVGGAQKSLPNFEIRNINNLKMRLPEITSIIRDPSSNITYNVFAFRKLSRDEIIDSIYTYYEQKKEQIPSSGSTITIMTSIGQHKANPYLKN